MKLDNINIYCNGFKCIAENIPHGIEFKIVDDYIYLFGSFEKAERALFIRGIKYIITTEYLYINCYSEKDVMKLVDVFTILNTDNNCWNYTKDSVKEYFGKF